MSGRSPLSATSAQQVELRSLARSDVRGEADRARAILLTLTGWTSGQVAEAFGVTADSVRHWRQWFADGGVDALRSTLAPGPSPAKGEQALAVATALLREPVENRPNWTLPRLQAEIERQTGLSISKSRLSILLREKGGSAGAAPRHTLNGRQDPDQVERVGLRLKLRQAQARAGDIVLLYGDESEALTHPYLAHAWARRGVDLRVAAPGLSRKMAMMGVLDAITRELIVHTSPTKRSADFMALLAVLDSRYGPRPGCLARPVVLVLDNGPVHTSKASMAALAARAWLIVEWLPRYAPELNEIEGAWRDLKRHHLAHQTFRGTPDLDAAIHAAVANLTKERQMAHPCDNSRSAA